MVLPVRFAFSITRSVWSGRFIIKTLLVVLKILARADIVGIGFVHFCWPALSVSVIHRRPFIIIWGDRRSCTGAGGFFFVFSLARLLVSRIGYFQLYTVPHAS